VRKFLAALGSLIQKKPRKQRTFKVPSLAEFKKAKGEGKLAMLKMCEEIKDPEEAQNAEMKEDSGTQ
jgi:hypothetical protein